jgi:predicted HAD superfamily Cof-like phosphohydrolase
MSIESALRDVARFHEVSDLVDIKPGQRAELLFRHLRKALIKEEYKELKEARRNEDMVKVTDAYVDLIYVILGSALQQVGKYRFAMAWMEVQRSNMAKCIEGKVRKRDDGKVLKPTGWDPPDLETIVNGPELECSPLDDVLSALREMLNTFDKVSELVKSIAQGDTGERTVEEVAQEAAEIMGCLDCTLSEVVRGVEQGAV